MSHGAGSAPLEGADADRNQAAAAVACWDGFPLDAGYRPTVLLAGTVRPEAGFRSGDAKLAFAAGAVDPAPGVPEEPVRLMKAALGSGGGRIAPLRLRAAVLTQAEFGTDRGTHVLEAWRVQAAEAVGPIWVLSADSLARCWSPPPLAGGHGGGLRTATAARGEANELVVEFVGGSEDLFDYEAEAVETSRAVAVVLSGRPRRPFRGPITLLGYTRRIGVRLAEPIGDRVLVDLDGRPVEVICSDHH